MKNEKIKRKLWLTKALRKVAKYCLKNDDDLKPPLKKRVNYFDVWKTVQWTVQSEETINSNIPLAAMTVSHRLFLIVYQQFPLIVVSPVKQPVSFCQTFFFLFHHPFPFLLSSPSLSKNDFFMVFAHKHTLHTYISLTHHRMQHQFHHSHRHHCCH